MKEELEAIVIQFGWEVGPGPGPGSKRHLQYWSVYPDIFGDHSPADEVIKLLILAGYDARPLREHLIAVWV